MEEPAQVIAPVDDSNVPIDTNADVDQGQAEDPDYGDGDADMDFGGYGDD